LDDGVGVHIATFSFVVDVDVDVVAPPRGGGGGGRWKEEEGGDEVSVIVVLLVGDGDDVGYDRNAVDMMDDIVLNSNCNWNWNWNWTGMNG
jgi:hypothetical protein